MLWHSYCCIWDGLSSSPPSLRDTSKSPFFTVISFDNLKHSGNMPMTEKPISMAQPWSTVGSIFPVGGRKKDMASMSMALTRHVQKICLYASNFLTSSLIFSWCAPFISIICFSWTNHSMSEAAEQTGLRRYWVPHRCTSVWDSKSLSSQIWVHRRQQWPRCSKLSAVCPSIYSPYLSFTCLAISLSDINNEGSREPEASWNKIKQSNNDKTDLQNFSFQLSLKR